MTSLSTSKGLQVGDVVALNVEGGPIYDAWRDEMFSLSTGDVGEVVELRNGFVIVQWKGGNRSALVPSQLKVIEFVAQ